MSNPSPTPSESPPPTPLSSSPTTIPASGPMDQASMERRAERLDCRQDIVDCGRIIVADAATLWTLETNEQNAQARLADLRQAIASLGQAAPGPSSADSAERTADLAGLRAAMTATEDEPAAIRSFIKGSRSVMRDATNAKECIQDRVTRLRAEDDRARAERSTNQ